MQQLLITQCQLSISW